MFRTILVRVLIVEGERLLEALGRNRFPLTAALWTYFPEAMEWRLVIVSPTVDRQGPLAAYTRVQRILATINPSELTLSNIALIGPDSEDYANLRGIISQSGRFHNSPAVDRTQNVIFDDAYVYPVAPPRR